MEKNTQQYTKSHNAKGSAMGEEGLRKRATAGLLLLLVSMAFGSSTLSVMLNQIINEFGLVSARQGTMSSLMMAGSLAAVVTVPFLQGRVRKTLMLTLGMAVQLASLLLTGSAPGFVPLLGACLLLGVSGGWLDTYANAAMVDIHREKSAKYMGLLHGCYGIGSIVAPLALQGILFLTSWRSAYFALAGFSCAILLLFVWISRSSRSVFQASGGAEKRLSLAQLRDFFRDRYSLLLVMSMLWYGASQIALTAWLVRYMAVRYGAEALGSLGISLFWLFVTLSRFIAPRLPVAPVKLVAAGMALTAGLQLAGFLSASPAFTIVMVAASGLTSGFAIPMLIHAAVSRHPGSTSLATTAIMLAMRAAQILIPLLLGLLAAVSIQLSMLVTVACAALTALAGGLAVRAGKKAGAGGA